MIQKHRDGNVSMWSDPHHLRWEPTEQGRAIKGQGWAVVKALGQVFGPPPWEFTNESLMQLEAMAAASSSDASKMYGELIAAIREHSSIRVWSPKWAEQHEHSAAVSLD